MRSVGKIGGPGSVEAASPSSGHTKSGSALDDGSSHKTTEPVYSAAHNMSAQSFIELHNTAITQANDAQSAGPGMKRLVEMMMAIELLRAMGEQ
jgi:hypothetical protein